MADNTAAALLLIEALGVCFPHLYNIDGGYAICYSFGDDDTAFEVVLLAF
jgi:hypothetical protein